MLCVLVSVCLAAASYQELNAQTPAQHRRKDISTRSTSRSISTSSLTPAWKEFAG